MKSAVLACVMMASPMAVADTSKAPCEAFNATDEVSTALTIEEIEKEAKAKLLAWRQERTEFPNALFGYAHAGWVGLKAMVQPGDEIVKYSTDQKSWHGLAGHKGFAVVRNRCIIGRFVTAQS